MRAFAPLVLEAKIKFYQWARRDMQARDPMHKDLPEVVRRLHELEAQRPPVVVRPPSRCAALPGMCARDPNCEDHRCPGRYGLHIGDGGHSFSHGVVFPIGSDDPAESVSF